MNIFTPYLTQIKIGLVVAALAAAAYAGYRFGSFTAQKSLADYKLEIAEERIQVEEDIRRQMLKQMEDGIATIIADNKANVEAAQKRQEARVRSAARQGAIEGLTRQESVYSDCRLDPETAKLLQEAMK